MWLLWLCFVQILKSGTYKVQIMYTSQIQASFKLSVGSWTNIKDGSAQNLKLRLPATVRAALTLV